MTLFSSPWHVISAFFVFILGIGLAISVRRYFNCSIKRVILLYFWHSLFCIVYCLYAIFNIADSQTYYKNSLSGDLEFSLGTRAVEVFTSLLTQGFGLSYLGGFLVFQIFGFIGLLGFDASLRDVTKYKSKYIKLLANIIVFLPSVSFWSSAIGKDSFSFMSVGLALWAALNIQNRLMMMIFSILIMLCVRPHIAGIMVIALCISFIFQRRISFGFRVSLFIISICSVAILIPFALKYAGVGEGANPNEVMNYIEARQGYNLDGGGGVDIASMSLPMKLFTYMFRPMPFEAHSITSLAASFENLILLLLFMFSIRSLIKNEKIENNQTHNRIFLWVYSLSTWGLLAMTTANLGIAVRQKWMFAPMLIILLISSFKTSSQKKADKERI